MGEMKRAQEQRVEQASVQKLRENHETLQRLTSQLQQMLEQMNSMYDSEDFQDVELNFCGRLSWFRVIVPCSAATKDCRLTLGINLDYRKMFLEINFLRLIHPDIILKEFNLTTCKETEKQSLKPEGLRLFTQVKTNWIKAQFQCRQVQHFEFHNACGITAELHGRTAKTANIGVAIRQIPSSTIVFSVEISVQKPSDYLFWFSIRCCVVDQRSGDGWFFGWVEILAISLWREFSKLRDAGREDCLCPEQDKIILNSQFKKKVSHEERKAQKGGPVSTRKTDRLRDLRLLSSDWRSWYCIWLC